MTSRRRRTGPVAFAVDLAAALRPQLWIAAVALFEAGRTAGPAPAPFPPSAAPAMVSLLALLGATHLGNAWRDRASDRLNRKGGAVAAGRLSGRVVGLAAAGCLLAAVGAAAVPPVPGASRLLLVAAAAMGAAYVIPPLELKRRAGFDLAAQALGYGVVAFSLGASCAGRLSPAVAAAALPYAGGIATVGLIAMIADREGDAASRQATTAVVLGPARAPALAITLAVATAAGGLAVRDAAPGLWGLVAVASLTLGERTGAAAWVRLAILLQILFALLLVPRSVLPIVATLLLGALTVLLSRGTSGSSYPLDAWSEPGGLGTGGGRRRAAGGGSG